MTTIHSISIKAMKERMARGESFAVLDVRSKNEFQNWQIKGNSLQAVNVPYMDYKEHEVNDRVMPEWSYVVFLSLADPAAQKAADRLQTKGYTVAELEGGFAAWDQFYVQSTIIVDPRMKLIQVHRLSTGCLSYAIITANQVVIVDPALHTDQYLRIAERENAKITHVMETHVHSDHISGAPALLAQTSAKYLIAHSEIHNNALPVELLRRGTIHVGSLDIHVLILDTEGEVRGSTLLVLGDWAVLAGDAVAIGEVGIADMPGVAQEWAEKLFNTVLREVKSLSDDIVVLPAHFADIQAVNHGGYIGALLGDIRLGAEAMSRANVVTFTNRPKGFVSVLHPISDDVKRVNTGLQSTDLQTAQEMENELRRE